MIWLDSGFIQGIQVPDKNVDIGGIPIRFFIPTMIQGEQRIAIEQVRVGLHIRLETWIDNPFLFRSFKIRNEKQLNTLRSLGLSEVFYTPEKSDATPLPLVKAVEPSAPPPVIDPNVAAMLQAKQERREKLARQRELFGRCEKQFTIDVSMVKNLMRNLFSRPHEAIEQAQALVMGMIDSLSTDQDVLIYTMNARSSDEGAYYHVLNVAMLSLMMGREAGLQTNDMCALGLGALLHDMGKERVPSRILLKKAVWTTAEQNFYLQHVAYGVEMAEKLPNLPAGAREVIAQHHEMLDGSGFPEGLRANKIGKLARIVAIANAFDNACNRINPEDSLTQAQALSVMLTRDRDKYDAVMVQHFVNCLGMYPPGSVVCLNSGAIGLVVNVNAEKLLQPTLLMYDPVVPKKEAILLDLTCEPDLSVIRTLRPAELPKQVWNYLNPRSGISYDAEAAA